LISEESCDTEDENSENTEINYISKYTKIENHYFTIFLYFERIIRNTILVLCLTPFSPSELPWHWFNKVLKAFF